MRHAALSVLIATGFALALPGASVPAFAEGTSIIRILPPEQAPPAPPERNPSPPDNKVVPTPPTPPPPTPPTPPDKRVETPTPPKQGQFVKLQLRRGATMTDNVRGWIGVRYDSLDRPLAISLGLMNPAGALILETFSGSPAAVGGLRPGDVVVSVDGGAVANPPQFIQRLQAVVPGNESTLEVWRYVPNGSDFISTLRSFAEQGNTSVMHRLGDMYNRGVAVPKDEAEAARWFRMGANAGNAMSMADLAQMLLEGRGVAQNTTEGLRLLKAAADTGTPAAMWQYALVLQNGKYTTKDLAGAAQLHQRAAEAGYHPAMLSYGVMLANGLGMPRNYQEAARWYEKAVAQNNSGAMVNLGILYQYGNGVEKNEVRAHELYERAANMGHPAGMHNLAVLLDKGQGGRRDSDRAADLVMRALRARHEFSFKQMTQNGASYTREFRLAMQKRLKDAGVYNGPSDGDFGQTTVAAITTYFNMKH